MSFLAFTNFLPTNIIILLQKILFCLAIILIFQNFQLLKAEEPVGTGSVCKFYTIFKCQIHYKRLFVISLPKLHWLLFFLMVDILAKNYIPFLSKIPINCKGMPLFIIYFRWPPYVIIDLFLFEGTSTCIKYNCWEV